MRTIQEIDNVINAQRQGNLRQMLVQGIDLFEDDDARRHFINRVTELFELGTFTTIYFYGHDNVFRDLLPLIPPSVRELIVDDDDIENENLERLVNVHTLNLYSSNTIPNSYPPNLQHLKINLRGEENARRFAEKAPELVLDTLFIHVSHSNIDEILSVLRRINTKKLILGYGPTLDNLLRIGHALSGVKRLERYESYGLTTNYDYLLQFYRNVGKWPPRFTARYPEGHTTENQHVAEMEDDIRETLRQERYERIHSLKKFLPGDTIRHIEQNYLG